MVSSSLSWMVESSVVLQGGEQWQTPSSVGGCGDLNPAGGNGFVFQNFT